ncbi:AraC family transcriptional regulator [Pedobacter steynii]|uniref:AraC family transcriptional regulator n=1 Tax=Pedobacter steynii TaxID=430522 RepID=UPI00155DC568|nr:AraC family transcriptional regulator [Pedobacter steynii]NQX38731.1 AraC family transcriptional regulator [Pedobacter steynii]
MKKTQNYYVKNINKVLDYIDVHIEHSFSLEELAAITSFSKFHFHRIFQSLIGESVFQYIMRIRLEKCASNMILEPDRKLSNIALQYGFSDLSIFSRHFKKHFNRSPSLFRDQSEKNSNNSQTDSNIQRINGKADLYFCSDLKTIKWTNYMEIIKNVEVQHLSEMTVAYVRNFGPYVGKSFSYEKSRNDLFAWSAAKGVMQDPNFKYLILYHDNPNVALNDNLRMSLCVTISDDTETDGAIGKMKINAGMYLVCDCELSAPDFGKVWEWIYGEWFPNNHYIPDDSPYFELYKEQPETEILKVSFCIPVKIKTL